MTIAAGSIAQNDTLVGPIITNLTTVANQIAGIGNVYPHVPDAPPEDNSVVFAPKNVGVRDDETNDKLVLEVEIDVIHLFFRRRLQDNLSLLVAALPAWLNVLTAWSNQTLFGVAQNMNLTRMDIAPYQHGKQDYLALVMSVSVRVVWNINMTL